MTALYVTSSTVAGGKTMLCAGVGTKLKVDKKHVGYFKPLSVVPQKNGSDKDAEFMKQLLSLSEPVESLCPVTATPDDIKSGKDKAHWLEAISAAYHNISKGKDVVLIEGSGDLQMAAEIVKTLSATAVLIVRWHSEMKPEEVLSAARALSGNLVGVVLNAVPQSKMEWAKSSLSPVLERNGIKTLGVFPEDRVLCSVTIGELAQYLGGNILNNAEQSDELVENLMVGAMTPDSALTYMSTRSNKAVIARGDRPDLQLAALDTSTRCLVLTNNLQPIPLILSRAQELKVPTMTVSMDTPTAMDFLGGIWGKTRFHQQRKMARLGEILAGNLDFPALLQAL